MNKNKSKKNALIRMSFIVISRLLFCFLFLMAVFVFYKDDEIIFNEIPIIIVNTCNHKDIDSKEHYVESTISITNTKYEWEMNDMCVGIRGRGNTTWNAPKKPYRIKFDKKQSLFGSSYKAKSWVLLANYFDKTLSRNYIAYELGEMLGGIAFSPKHTFVDLYVNKEYKGVYLLCDQIQTGKGRVDIDKSISTDGNNGYLIERDYRAREEGQEGVDYFFFNNEAYSIRSPKTDSETFLSNSETEIKYITNYMNKCLNAIKSEPWEKVQELVDIDSFVDSYIIDELFANNDCGSLSCYYYKDKNGKLTKGPLWDFDLGAGNIDHNMGNKDECLPNTKLYAREVNTWYKKLTKREEFSNILRERFANLKSTITNCLDALNPQNDDGVYLTNKNAFERNFDKWKIMGKYVWPEPKSVYQLDTVELQFIYLFNWLLQRQNYLDSMF